MRLPRAFCGRVGLCAAYNLHKCTSNQSAIKTRAARSFIKFSCYRRLPLLDGLTAKETFELTLERVRVWYGCYIGGYVGCRSTCTC